MFNQLRDTVNRAMPTMAFGLVRPRGLLMPLDPWMRGTLRFAYKLGGHGSVWRPNLQAKAVLDSGGGESILFVGSIWKDLVLDSIILVNKVRHQIIDWDDSNISHKTLVLNNQLTGIVETNTAIYLYAFPVTVEGGMAKGSTTLRVSTPYYLAIGDRVEIPTVASGTDTWKLTIPIDVVEVDYVKEDSEGYKYILTLEHALARNIGSDETIWMRAFPAYFSGNINLPVFGAVNLNVVGPFLLDFMSGPLITGTQFEEFVAVTQKSANGTRLTPSQLVGNHSIQINRMPIRADQFLFWRCIKGFLNWNGTEVVCQLDTDGEWRLIERQAPHMNVLGTFPIGAIVPIAKEDLQNNEDVTLDDGNLSITFEFKVSDVFVPTPGKYPLDIRSTTTAFEVGAVISSAINSVQQLPITLDLALISDNVTLVASDGVNYKTFEFKKTGAYLPGDDDYITVDVSGAADSDAAASILATSIDNNFSGLTATALGGATGTLNVLNSTLLVTGFHFQSEGSGVEIGEVSKLSIVATNKTSLVSLINKIQGTTGNVAIVDTVANPGFVVSGMTGGGGGLEWVIKVVSNGDATIIIQLHPNAYQATNLVAGVNNISVTLNPNDQPVTHIDIRIASNSESSTPATEVKFSDWECLGSRTRILDTSVVIRVDNDNFAASALYLKPLWPNLDIIRTVPDKHAINSPSVMI